MVDKLNEGINKNFAILVLLSFLFPWVSFSLNNMDTQPWAFLLSAVYILLIFTYGYIKKSIAKTLFMGIYIVVFAVIISFVYFGGLNLDFSLIRGVFSYLTFFFVYAAYLLIYRRYGFSSSVFVFANIVWLVAGVLQVAINPYVLDFLVQVRTSETRGVTGLSPEPTFYGFMLFFLNFIYLIQYNYKLEGLIKALFYINLIFIVLVAQSSSVILLLFVAMLFVLVYRLRIQTMIIALIGFFLVLALFNSMFPDSRFFHLLGSLLDNGPLYLLSVDESVFARIMSIVYPYYWFYENNFIPGGFSSISTLPAVKLEIDGYLFEYDVQGKIMSYFGSIFYEMGILGLFILYFFIRNVYDETFKSILELLFLLFCLQFALTIAFSLIPILLVTFFCRKKIKINSR